MAELTDYLDMKTLQRLQDEFSAVAGQPVCICTSDGRALLAPCRAEYEATPSGEEEPCDLKRIPCKAGYVDTDFSEAQVVVDDEVIGQVRLLREATAEGSYVNAALEPMHKNLMPLMANMLEQFCRGAVQLRSRIQQLVALHKVTAQITTGGYDFQKVLDTITRTVVEATDAKASTIRLLAADGQELVIRSGCNLSDAYLDKGVIRLDQSLIDQEAVQTGKPVYIADIPSDPRVVYPDAASREGFASGLCAPMVFKGRCEGLIRVYMGQTHKFDWFETELIKTIANAAAAAISHSRLHEDAVHSWEIKRQVAMAGEVQRRMIPDRSPSFEGFDIFGEYVPSQQLAGDFYDYINLPPDNLGIAICDVVGKGVRASLLMASIRASLRAHARNVYDMSEVLEQVNRDLCADTLISDFATMFYGVLNSETLELTYSCAGHLPPMLVRDGKCTELEAAGGVLGIFPDMDYPISRVDLLPGDVILIYTDGLNEAANFEGEQFGRQRIAEALQFAAAEGFSAQVITRHCLWCMRRFAGIQQRGDDTTLVAIRVK
ncbi:MAG: SpoIIE family protein phosphatase [Phycisphaerae bacterium]|nr:SpoIIE family protein phosphatase [Phycisphaerae bacterium]